MFMFYNRIKLPRPRLATPIFAQSGKVEGKTDEVWVCVIRANIKVFKQNESYTHYQFY
jgi:hypothetical protein